jgi:aspartate 1-decarboxylase
MIMEPYDENNLHNKLTVKVLKAMFENAEDDDIVMIADYRTVKNFKIKAVEAKVVITESNKLIIHG